ncbi:MAG: prepilin-type N-terminal cleavage/methylation domain-containing protein [Nitrospiraceae bacterium]|nr:MAG: prepilin-type N-terminal cleavage/methylation domain-containing protein [Nitrospiraceae bacterium]
MTIYKKDNNKGFTLIELLIVMGIIAILGTIGVTSYIGSTLKATRSEAYTNLQALRMHEEQFFAENAQYTTDIAGDFQSFQPGPASNYVYLITNLNVALPAAPVAVPYNNATVAQANCFIATATGIAGTRVAGDIFAIDCNNNRNF